MKLEAAEEGAPVLMQTVGSRTVRPSMKPTRERLVSTLSRNYALQLTFPAVVVGNQFDDRLTNSVAGLWLKWGVPGLMQGQWGKW